MHPALSRTGHRPWPLPRGEWTWRQSWCDLLFAHWPIEAERLRALVPEPLRVQEFEGRSWIGVVPFRMEGVMRRTLPDLPGLSAFPKCNLRIYVDLDGRPGVWFLSLDATNPVAVWAARRFFHLPYHLADICFAEVDGRIRYATQRRDRSATDFAAHYVATSDPYESTPGTLEAWLTERYCLYALAPDDALHRTEVHHHPWPLQRAEVEILPNRLLEPHDLEVEGPPALVHFSKRIDVVIWTSERVSP